MANLQMIPFPAEPRRRKGGSDSQHGIPSISKQKPNLAIELGEDLQLSIQDSNVDDYRRPRESFDTSSDSINARKKRGKTTKRERLKSRPLPQPELINYEEGDTMPAPQLLLGGDSEAMFTSPKSKRSKRASNDRKSRAGKKANKLEQIPKKNISSQDLLLSKKPKKARMKTPQARSPSKMIKSGNKNDQNLKKEQTGKDNYMVAILPTPDEKSDENDFVPRRLSKLPAPRFPKGAERGDGLMPLETLAETTEVFTNAFRTDLYEGVRARRKATAPERDLSRPIPNWFQFQVPIPSQCGISEEERMASREYDINRLLHAVKIAAL